MVGLPSLGLTYRGGAVLAAILKWLRQLVLLTRRPRIQALVNRHGSAHGGLLA